MVNSSDGREVHSDQNRSKAIMMEIGCLIEFQESLNPEISFRTTKPKIMGNKISFGTPILKPEGATKLILKGVDKINKKNRYEMFDESPIPIANPMTDIARIGNPRTPKITETSTQVPAIT